jgi:hypothetical protein
MNPLRRASRRLGVNQENNLDLSKPRQIQCAAKEFWNRLGGVRQQRGDFRSL